MRAIVLRKIFASIPLMLRSRFWLKDYLVSYETSRVHIQYRQFVPTLRHTETYQNGVHEIFLVLDYTIKYSQALYDEKMAVKYLRL